MLKSTCLWCLPGIQSLAYIALLAARIQKALAHNVREQLGNRYDVVMEPASVAATVAQQR